MDCCHLMDKRLLLKQILYSVNHLSIPEAFKSGYPRCLHVYLTHELVSHYIGWLAVWVIYNSGSAESRIVLPFLFQLDLNGKFSQIVPCFEHDVSLVVNLLIAYYQAFKSIRFSVKMLLIKLAREASDGERIRNVLYQRQAFLDAAVEISKKHKLDILNFMNLTFTMDAKSQFETSEIGHFSNSLLLVREYMSKLDVRSVSLCLLIRTYILLIAVWKFQLSDEETKSCLQLDEFVRGHDSAKLYTCLLMLIADRSHYEVVEEVKAKLQNILCTKYSDFCHILGVYFLTDQSKEVIKLFGSALRIQYSLQPMTYKAFATFFKDIFSDERIATTAVALAERNADSPEELEDISIELTYKLITLGTFRETNVDVKPAIIAIIKNTKMRHKLLPDLLTSYCQSRIEGGNNELPIDSGYIESVFQTCGIDEKLSEKLLLCFCIFFHYQCWIKSKDPEAATYDAVFLDSYTLRPIIDHAQENITSSLIYSKFIEMVSEQYPEYFEPNFYLLSHSFSQPLDLLHPGVYSMIDSQIIGPVDSDTFLATCMHPESGVLRTLFLNFATEQSNVLKILKAVLRQPSEVLILIIDPLLLFLTVLLVSPR